MGTELHLGFGSLFGNEGNEGLFEGGRPSSFFLGSVVEVGESGKKWLR